MYCESTSEGIHGADVRTPNTSTAERFHLRLPSGEDYVAQVSKEHRWLPVLSGQLPLVTFTRQDGEWKADPEFMSAVSQALIRHADEALKFRIVTERAEIVVKVPADQPARAEPAQLGDMKQRRVAMS